MFLIMKHKTMVTVTVKRSYEGVWLGTKLDKGKLPKKILGNSLGKITRTNSRRVQINGKYIKSSDQRAEILAIP